MLLNIYIKGKEHDLDWVDVYGISTTVGYLMSNHVYIYIYIYV